MDKKIKYAICAHSMNEAYGNVIIGFSGGADSSLLLHYFAKKAKRVVCVHVNHMIRGDEAERDQRFCEDACKKYGVELVTYKIDIPAISKKTGKGIEETARDERYRVFYVELERRGFDAILTAHNGDDNCESVIFNMARGAGLNGLCGIKPKNGKVLRPLIYLSKDEIISFCAENNIEYVTDSTNADTDYTRNFIRHNIIPKMKKLNPELNSSISRMTEGFISDEDFILSQAKDFMLEFPHGEVNTKKLKLLHPSVRARALKLMAGQSLDYKSVRMCEELLCNSECGSYVDLSGGLAFKKERDFVHFLKKEKLDSVEYCYELYDGLEISELGVRVGINSSEQYGEKQLSVSLSAKAASGKLYIRSRRDGDKMVHNGMTKKVKRILCDRHIPSHLRDRIPIIFDENGIVALGDICVRDGCKYRGDGEKTEITFYQIMNK